MNQFNPFFHTAAIYDSKYFFGRTKETEELLSLLLVGNLQCQSIVGQRKIGKSSFLLHIARKETRRNVGYETKKNMFLYLDCQQYHVFINDLESLYKVLVDKLLEEIPQHLDSSKIYYDLMLEQQKQPTYYNFWFKSVQYLNQLGVGVICLFDEFEKLVFKEELILGGAFGTLRALAQHNKFAWVTSTSTPLRDLFMSAYDSFNIPEIRRKSESDFFNIAPGYMVINTFQEEEAKNCIQQLSGLGEIEFQSSELALIHSLGGNFPYFLQRASFFFLNGVKNGLYSEAKIIDRFMQDVGGLWENYWQKLTANQQDLLWQIVTKSQVNAQRSEIAKLKEVALIIEDNSQVNRPFSEQFGKFVLEKNRQFSHKPQQDEFQKVDVEEDHTKSLFAILNAENIPVGTGFLVKFQGRLWAITCRHNLAELNKGNKDELLIEPFDTKLKKTKLTINDLAPVEDSDPKKWLADEDIFVQEIPQYNIDGICYLTLDARIKPVNQTGCWCFGYVKSKNLRGDYINNIVIEERAGVHRGFYQFTQIGNERIEQGVSGAPLFSAKNEVIGMIQSKHGTSTTAYLIPVNPIIEKLRAFGESYE